MNDPNLSSFIWSVADLLRGDYKQADYGKVILPLTVLRRLDCVLADTKAKVLERHQALKGGETKNLDPILNRITRVPFHNISKLDFAKLKGDPNHIAANLSAYIQGNNFSGIVSNILCDSFSRLTPYKHNHDQQYPDLILRPTRGLRNAGLEVKTTIRPGKGGESHNGHSGWHVIACYELDKTSGDICFIHIMFANLVGHGRAKADWKYVGSTVNKDTGSQRTETYVTTPGGTAKLRHGTVYLNRQKINVSRWRTSPAVPAPLGSPFKKRPVVKKARS